MPSYRRFVTYLFQYENQERNQNCGFAKIEVRQGQCRMELQLRGVPDGAGEVYLLTGPGNDICGIRIGELQIRSGAGRRTFVFAADAVGDTAYGLDDMKGIYLSEEGGRFAASQWGDEALDWGSFHLYEESENGKAHAETEPEETPETEPETVPEQEGDSETGQQKEPEPETGAEIHAAQTAAAEAPARGGKIAAVREPAWEQQWKRFAAAHPVFCPFDEAQDIYAVKMDLRDFKILPKEYLPLANNSFLLHGYFNYKFLLFGYMGEQEKKWFLGVPGVFQNQEQLLAGLFGFGEFRTKHMTKQKTGEFGYWYRYLG